jgi:hypothetical protein
LHSVLVTKIQPAPPKNVSSKQRFFGFFGGAEVLPRARPALSVGVEGSLLFVLHGPSLRTTRLHFHHIYAVMSSI